jgi:hypothetical protein
MLRKQSRIKPTQEEKEVNNAKKASYMREHCENNKLEMIVE